MRLINIHRVQYREKLWCPPPKFKVCRTPGTARVYSRSFCCFNPASQVYHVHVFSILFALFSSCVCIMYVYLELLIALPVPVRRHSLGSRFHNRSYVSYYIGSAGRAEGRTAYHSTLNDEKRRCHTSISQRVE